MASSTNSSRILYVVAALHRIDHDDFHFLKFRQLCSTVRSASSSNSTAQHVDFHMLAFTKSGTYVTMWLDDDTIARVEADRGTHVALSPDDLGYPALEVADVREAVRERRAEARPVMASDVSLLAGSAMVLGCRREEDGAKGSTSTARTLCLVRVSPLCAFDCDRVRSFARFYSNGGGAHLVIGAHGHGDSLSVGAMVTRQPQARGFEPLLGVEIASDYHRRDDERKEEGDNEEEEEKKKNVCVTVRTLGDNVFRGCKFASVVLDCCLMATVQAASAFALSTRFLVACEGYMWEEDDDVERHVLNSASAAALCFGSPPSTASPSGDALTCLNRIVEKFGEVSARGDAAVISTAHALELYDHLIAGKGLRTFVRGTYVASPITSGVASATAHSSPYGEGQQLIAADLCAPLDDRDDVGGRLYDLRALLDRAASAVDAADGGGGSGSSGVDSAWLERARDLLQRSIVAAVAPREGVDYYGTLLNGLSIRL